MKLNIRSLRIITGGALVGAALAGALFGWAPAVLGVLGAHEIGALVGAGLGAVANARHMV